jgi:hypothetical protein
MTASSPTEIVVEHAGTRTMPLIMRWQGRGIRFQALLWHRPEMRGANLHHLFCMRDDTQSYTLDFDTLESQWMVTNVEALPV